MFRTEFTIPPVENKITHQSSVLSIGSCFSEVIGNRLQQNKFPTVVNPFGTLFNPISIVKIIEAVLDKKYELLFAPVKNQDVWFSYHMHSSIYAESEVALKKIIEDKINAVHEQLINSDFLIITLGSAYVHNLISDNSSVANCHKMPGTLFEKELLPVDAIVGLLENIFQRLKKENSKLTILLTVSPVRHTKDTVPLNMVSKSILRLACHQIAEKFTNVNYFPSYEIMIDDLRDYRFYKEDLIHPNETAEHYIWDKFSKVYFDESTVQVNKEWEGVRKSLEHKPFRENTEVYKKFLEDTLLKLEKLGKKLELSEEKVIIKNLLNTKFKEQQ